MKVSIFPDTSGDKILRLDDRRPHNDEAAGTVPTLFVCDSTGAEVGFGRLFEVRDGGGHLEAKGFLIDQGATGFVPGGNGLMQVTG